MMRPYGGRWRGHNRTFYTGKVGKLILKFKWKSKQVKITRKILKREKMGVRLVLPNIAYYTRGIIIKIVW